MDHHQRLLDEILRLGVGTAGASQLAFVIRAQVRPEPPQEAPVVGRAARKAGDEQPAQFLLRLQHRD